MKSLYLCLFKRSDFKHNLNDSKLIFRLQIIFLTLQINLDEISIGNLLNIGSDHLVFI